MEGWALECKTGSTTSYERGILSIYCVWPLNSLGRAEPAGLGNNHFSPYVMESLPQLGSLKLHLDSIVLSQTFTAVAAAATA